MDPARNLRRPPAAWIFGDPPSAVAGCVAPGRSAAGLNGPAAYLAIGVPALILAPFVALAAYAFPQLDDFCFGGVWLDEGFVGTLRFFYDTFVGRLFANGVIMAPFVLHHELHIDLLTAYRLICAVVLLATIATALWIGAGLLAGASRPERLFLGLALAVALIAGNPAPNDLFYWVSQIGNYSIAALVTLALMVWLHRAAQRGDRLRPGLVALLIAVGLVVSTANEFSGPVLFAVLLGAFLQRRLTPGAPRQAPAHMLILLAILAGTLVVALAPGNAVRLGVYGRNEHLALHAALAFPKALLWLGQFLFQRAASPALVAWVAILVLATLASERRPGPDEASARLRCLAWLPLATALAAIYGALWIGQLGLGGILPPRARGHLHFVLVGGLTLTSIMATRLYREQLSAWLARRRPGLSARRLGAALLVLMAAAPHFLWAVYSLGWQAGPLARAVAARFARFEPESARSGPASERELVLPPLSPRARLVMIDDVREDPEHWSNRCLARYVGVRSVRLAAPPIR